MGGDLRSLKPDLSRLLSPTASSMTGTAAQNGYISPTLAPDSRTRLGQRTAAAPREHAKRYGVAIVMDRIERVGGKVNVFQARSTVVTLDARATMSTTEVKKRFLCARTRYASERFGKRDVALLPVCDTYEATWQTVGVIGGKTHAVAEALFLHTFRHGSRASRMNFRS